ncbi:MAG: hypothetical protein JOZ69_20020, partial [Myxococcales bacterium]|nr:hypothetical protein [Myxococcales bacterium]
TVKHDGLDLVLLEKVVDERIDGRGQQAFLVNALHLGVHGGLSLREPIEELPIIKEHRRVAA